jgi:transposase-like protein
MAKNTRTYRTAEEKGRILRRHLEKGEAVSSICEEEGLQPSVFYSWQRDLFARMDGVLSSKPGTKPQREKKLEERVAYLEGRLARKDEIIADVSEECLKLKKTLGEP